MFDLTYFMTFHVGSRLENTSLLSFFDFNILKHEGNFRQQEIVRVGYLQLEKIVSRIMYKSSPGIKAKTFDDSDYF